MNGLRIGAVVAKEGRELARDPITIGVSLLIPLVMLFLFGYAISLDVENVHFGVWDRDQTPASRSLIDGFAQSGYFRLTRSFRTGDEVEAALQTGSVKLALVIPERFHAALARGDGAPVQLLLDGTFSATAQIIASYATAIVHRFGQPPVERVGVEIRAWYNPDMRSVNYVIPGLFGVILMAFPPLLTALAIVREKESGSIQHIFASPLTPAEYIVGKLIPYGLIAFVQILMVIVVGFLWFDVPFRGNLGVLLGAGLIYVFCTVALGLLVSTITRSQVVAMLLTLILTLMPSFLFSGFLFPIFTMPYFLQLYTYVFPSRYFVELSRAVVMKGAGLQEIWVNIGLLILYTVAAFSLAAWRFRKKVA
jgi:ABC-2 type transport system permease protein